MVMIETCFIIVISLMRLWSKKHGDDKDIFYYCDFFDGNLFQKLLFKVERHSLVFLCKLEALHLFVILTLKVDMI